jgi:hypothetical protein
MTGFAKEWLELHVMWIPLFEDDKSIKYRRVCYKNYGIG